MHQARRQHRPAPPQPAPASAPAETVRAVVTGAIALVLIGAVLSIAGNSDSGSSAVVRTVKGRLFSPWMTPPWLDLGFDYRLSYGAQDDADHSVEVRRHGDERGGTVSLPGALTGERAARWRRLARAIALDADDADRDGLLVAALGRGMFADIGGADASVRILRRPPTDRGGQVPDPSSAYTARVRLVRGDLQVLRQEARGEVAPLVSPPTGAGDGPRKTTP